MFVPVRSLADIPEGKAFERIVLELKGHPHAYKAGMRDGATNWNTFEMAKDVAAFASGIGGSIVIGAVQARRGLVLETHNPVDAAALAEFQSTLRNAIKDRCSPPPFLDPTLLPLREGALLALNVWPFPGQPIAVQVDASEESGYRGAAHVYPMRVGDGTTYLRPEQLAMFMSPEIRRRAIVLRSLRANAEVVVHPVHRIMEQALDPFRATFHSLDEQNNRVDLRFPGPTGLTSLPIDQLQAVWLATGGVHILFDAVQFFGFMTVRGYFREPAATP